MRAKAFKSVGAEVNRLIAHDTKKRIRLNIKDYVGNGQSADGKQTLRRASSNHISNFHKFITKLVDAKCRHY